MLDKVRYIRTERRLAQVHIAPYWVRLGTLGQGRRHAQVHKGPQWAILDKVRYIKTREETCSGS